MAIKISSSNNFHTNGPVMSPSDSPSPTNETSVEGYQQLVDALVSEFYVVEDDTIPPEWTYTVLKSEYHHILNQAGLDIERQSIAAEQKPALDTRAGILYLSAHIDAEQAEAQARRSWNGLPPNEESRHARSTIETYPIGRLPDNNEIQVSKQVHKDYGRSIQVFVNGKPIKPQSSTDEFTEEEGATGYGLIDGDWNTEGNKLLDMFQVLAGSIGQTTAGDEMGARDIHELIHTALEGSCQTFDAILSNPMNLALQQHGCVFINAVKPAPTVKIEVTDQVIRVHREQPMLIKDTETLSMFSGKIEREFEVEIRTGICQPKDAAIVIDWQNQKAM